MQILRLMVTAATVAVLVTVCGTTAAARASALEWSVTPAPSPSRQQRRLRRTGTISPREITNVSTQEHNPASPPQDNNRHRRLQDYSNLDLSSAEVGFAAGLVVCLLLLLLLCLCLCSCCCGGGGHRLGLCDILACVCLYDLCFGVHTDRVCGGGGDCCEGGGDFLQM